MHKPFTLQLTATLDHHEEDWVIFALSGGGELQLPSSQINPHLKEGTTFFINISDAPYEEAHREKLAKTLLNQILRKDGTS